MPFYYGEKIVFVVYKKSCRGKSILCVRRCDCSTSKQRDVEVKVVVHV